jgi:hypothetical protein
MVEENEKQGDGQAEEQAELFDNLQPDMEESALRKLALDIIAGQVFGSWMLPEHSQQLMGNIFMCLLFSKKGQIPSNVEQVYEYYNQAGKMAINGYPIFFSMRLLTEDDCTRLQPLLQQLHDQQQAFIGDADGGTERGDVPVDGHGSCDESNTVGDAGAAGTDGP